MVSDRETQAEYRVTGVMSGSSLDGVDLAFCCFSAGRSGWSYRILRAETIPYPPPILEQLSGASGWDRTALRKMDVTLGHFYAEQIHSFHERIHRIPDFIASHGHTLIHRPENGITFQAGNGEIMARETGLTVVNDFRKADVAQGGQGAPLVPAGDRLLFGEYDGCLNLGGFANISYEDDIGRRIGYDICPVNLALNKLAGRAGKTFDKDGVMARQGRVGNALLEALNHLDYYRVPPPKSLGKEWFEKEFVPVLESASDALPDLMATVIEHICIQISFCVRNAGMESVLVTGGGALNPMLMERLQHHTKARLVIPDRQLVEFKEALVFAFLGVLRVRNEINCLASVTGGQADLSAGEIHQ